MGIHVTYAEIKDLHITEDEAVKIYAVLGEYPNEYLAFMWRSQILERWGKGEDIIKLALLVLQAAYRWHEKANYGSAFEHANTKEMCRDIYAIAGIEEPERQGRGTVHGG